MNNIVGISKGRAPEYLIQHCEAQNALKMIEVAAAFLHKFEQFGPIPDLVDALLTTQEEMIDIIENMEKK